MMITTKLKALTGVWVLLLCMLPANIFPQAWTKEEGQVYTKISYGSSTASTQFSFDGNEKEYADNVIDDAFFDRSFYLYTEVGLTENLTVTGTLPFKRIIIRDAAFRYRTYSFGDLQLGARLDLKSLIDFGGDNDALAGNLNVNLPLFYYRNLTPSAGAGQVNADLNISYGRSFYPAPAYAQASLGYRYRSDIYALSDPIPCREGVDKDCFADNQPTYEDEFLLAVEGGYTLEELVLVQAMARVNWALTAPETGFTVANPIPTKQRYLKLGAGLGVTPYEDLWLSAQGFITPYGRNTVNSFDLYLGIDYTFTLF